MELPDALACFGLNAEPALKQRLGLVLQVREVGAGGQMFGRHNELPCRITASPDVRIHRQKVSCRIVRTEEGGFCLARGPDAPLTLLHSTTRGFGDRIAFGNPIDLQPCPNPTWP